MTTLESLQRELRNPSKIDTMPGRHGRRHIGIEDRSIGNFARKIAEEIQ
jgi:hypothetical protein